MEKDLTPSIKKAAAVWWIQNPNWNFLKGMYFPAKFAACLELENADVEYIWMREVVFPWWENLSLHNQVDVSEENGYLRQQVAKDEYKLCLIYLKEHEVKEDKELPYFMHNNAEYEKIGLEQQPDLSLPDPNRAIAIKWWNDLNIADKCFFFQEYKPYSPAGSHLDLTGREIQNIWEVKTTPVSETELEEQPLNILASFLTQHDIRKYTCINGFGYSQSERDCVKSIIEWQRSQDKELIQELMDALSFITITNQSYTAQFGRSKEEQIRIDNALAAIANAEIFLKS